MAGLARLIRDIIGKAFANEDKRGSLHQQLDGFKTVLLHDLTADQFADMYAQTIAYGLFAARVNAPDDKDFTREHAAFELPKTNPFLRKMFTYLAGPDLDSRIEWAVDDLAELLRRADMAAILKDFGRRKRQEDPVVHFYETFLAAYDPRMREARGVYYTPEPVVSFIVQSVDYLLRTVFKLPDGLADSGKISVPNPQPKARAKTVSVHRVQILDPATGTGTFLHGVIDQIHSRLSELGQAGAWSPYVSEHLLPRLFGFELLMAPYAVAHMKLGLQLRELGYDFGGEERLGIFLTNTLEQAHEMTGLPLFAQWIAEEAHAASEVKEQVPVMVVLGNPPYSGHSENKGVWIADLIETYKHGFPDLRKPGQAKWLSDDYVKFIRFAQWRIDQTGYGVLAFISNNGYLDNPTFRGMRLSLMESFDEIYVLDLHGSTKKREVSPDGTPDENVFDIQQGVAIGLFVKRTRTKKELATVRRAEVWGPRETWREKSDGHHDLIGGKYLWLWQNSIATTEWDPLTPEPPFYLFAPQDRSLSEEYEAGWALPAIFARNGDPAPGIVTTHDDFAISWSREDATEKVERLLATSTEAEARELFRLCSQDQWQYQRAKSELSTGEWREQLTPILYRPFDVRWTVFNRNVAVHRRERVMGHMLAGPNIGLSTPRKIDIQGGWEHVFCSRQLIQHHTVSLKEVNYLFPLYLYPEGFLKGPREANLASEFIAALTTRLGRKWIADGSGDGQRTVGPDDVFHYIYALLHSTSYRQRYAKPLRLDFPRIPLTATPRLFDGLSDHGRILAEVHTLDRFLPITTRYPISGDDEVEEVRYSPPTPRSHPHGRVFINKTQHFEGVSPEVWEFRIGGYQVADRWLKDRKGRKLGYEDLTHYRHVLAALGQSLSTMADIDELIRAHGGWPLTGASAKPKS